MNSQERHNQALDNLQEYKYYLEKQVIDLKKLDQTSEFMRKWNEDTIKEREKEIVVIQEIIRSMIRFPI
jgi:hypothetical protein